MSLDDKDERIRALEDEVRRLKQMLESAPSFITRITLDGAFLFLNRLAPGFRMEDVLGTSVDSYVPEEFRERQRAAMRAAVETGQVQEYATAGRIGPRRVGHYLTRVSPIIEDERATSLVMVATDVTELEEHRTLLQMVVNATGLGIWTFDPANDGGTWDATTRRIFGLDDQQPAPELQAVLRERIHPDDRELLATSVARAVAGGSYGNVEYRVLLPGGQLRWVVASGVAITGGDGSVLSVVGSVMDITHRRTLEAQLQEAQKLESIGRVAGGIAHDFNNLLTAIFASLDLADRANSLEQVRPRLEEIRLTAERSAGLTAQLLTFARRQVLAPRLLQPSQLFKQIEPVLRRLLSEDIELRLSLDGVGYARADASQLEQVVLNLITNARDSIAGRGHVTLSTYDVVLEAADPLRPADLPPGPYAAFAVADTGGGIAPAALPQVFEPFFTTRAGGTGLGLATCYGIVKQSGGNISVQSELGHGARFVVLLPRVEAPRASGGLGGLDQSRNSERVLLVDDEPVVRAVVERTLSLARYRVTAASCAEDALRIAEEQGPFDLLITDIVMPGMHGWELGRRLAVRWPSMRALYISGYTEAIDPEGAPVDPSLPFLPKPFLPAELLATVRKLLDS